FHPGTSTTTLVDFTEATASTPGANSNSSAASRLINDTTRYGPAWISTWAMTLSFVTLVTRPGKLLRADWATGRSDGLVARSAEKRANAAPSTSRRPPSERAA